MQFRSVTHALAWYRLHNPARQKFQNLIEPDKNAKPFFETFSGNHPDDIFASVTNGIEHVLERYCNGNERPRAAFLICDVYRDKHPDQAAEWLSVTPNTVYRWLRQIRDDLERELDRRGLISSS